MGAKMLDGKKIAAEIKEEIKQEVEHLKELGVIPCLAGIIVGEDPSSNTYIRLKAKACEEVGIKESMYRLSETITEYGLIGNIEMLNRDKAVHGIFIQLPLPKHLSEDKALAAVLPEKDVDGMNSINVGRAWLGQSAYVPAGAIAIQEMLVRSGYDPKEKDIVIVNPDNLVGKPLASILIQDREKAGANVTLCHPVSPDLASYTRRADILVVAANRPKFITADMIKKDAVVIDFGITLVMDPATQKRKTVGDVDFEEVKEKAAAISPVPGGVGPLLVTMLLMNTIRAARQAAELVGK
jgi:methylenetetrahydrofolate dehydrogenase (NADP+)/methenyltetrahydrofolate cyclohydrolase